MTKLTAAELAAETVELLPDRDTLWTFNVASVNAYNSSVALNLFTIHSEANSGAWQYVSVSQH
ncbi:hypothetical protein [Sinomonas susongensis]|uniref:hypothetical protein n=1 Tax=Sinomonas susongensis TaxID=1324851 RepID=UPI001107E90E|nr:hypothetical protein [Sinomonas susongensis]